MSEPNLRIVRPQANAAPDDDKMVVQLTVGEFRQLIADTVKETMNSKRRILDVQGAMAFLNVSHDWIYRHWKQIGGRKIGKAIRFCQSDLNGFMKSPQGI
jgi:predicted DNA-binding transcriptional regulator AlpA